MTLQELKVAAYDTLRQIERLQIQLRQINEALVEVEKQLRDPGIVVPPTEIVLPNTGKPKK